MPTGMSLPSFTSAATRGPCGASQANIQAADGGTSLDKVDTSA
jgi:hypothetical protein